MVNSVESEDSTVVSFRIPGDLLEKLDELCEREQRTRSNMILVLMRKVLERPGADAPYRNGDGSPRAVWDVDVQR